MTKVKILTNGGYGGQDCQDAIGKVFDAKISIGMALVDLDDGCGYVWGYTIGTECEIVSEETQAPNYAAMAREYGIRITSADGVVYDGRCV